MKHGIRPRILLLFVMMVLASCGTQSSIYEGRHTLNGETVRKQPPIVKNAEPTRMVVKNTAYNSSDTIAVMDFNAKDVSQSIALSVSELIRTELINNGKYTVIERSSMKEILNEQGFQQTGCTDTSCAVKIGKLLSAKKILVGSVMRLGSKLIISGRIIDVEKGIGERAASGKADSVEQLDVGVIEFINNI